MDGWMGLVWSASRCWGRGEGGKRRGGNLREEKVKEEEGREEKGELAAYFHFLVQVQKSVAKSSPNNVRKPMEGNITFTCIRATSGVCYAGKSNVLF